MSPRARFKNLFTWRYLLVAVFFACTLLSPVAPRAQQESPARRKLVNHPAAPYPALARTMALAGIVKVDALVAPDGTVKGLNVKGGHPVLAQAAANTIRQWKWEPASHESHELIEIRFSPPE
ncbi:MAG: energy transducer TonB [Bdellovibrionota bacterium]